MFAIQIKGPEEDRRIVHLSADKAVIGRHRTCDIQLDHETVSKRHVEIIQTEKGFIVRDLGSYNGTFVNGRWVSETPVKRGDEIRIGRFLLTLITGPDKIEPALPHMLFPREGDLPAGKPVSNLRTIITFALIIACAVQASVLLYLFYVNPAGKKNQGKSFVKLPGKTIQHETFEKTQKTQKTQTGKPVAPLHNQSSHIGSGFAERGNNGPVKNHGQSFTSGVEPVKVKDLHPLKTIESGKKGKTGQVVESGKKGKTGQVVVVRPVFKIEEVNLPVEKEILIRRVYLDLCGRPPAGHELKDLSGRRISSIVRDLVTGSEFQSLWKGGVLQVITDIWGEKISGFKNREEAISHLAGLYQGKMASRPKQKKNRFRLLNSLFVDFWLRKPEEGEIQLFIKVLDGNDPAALQLPLCVFFLGQVNIPESPREWIVRIFTRFLLRRPTPKEEKEALKYFTSNDNLRGFILGLASSEAYLYY